MQTTHRKKMSKTQKMHYAFFDGDNVGSSIERLLSNNQIHEATHLSERIKLAILKIELLAASMNGVEILISGGDDVLIKFDRNIYDYSFLNSVSRIFVEYICVMSPLLRRRKFNIEANCSKDCQ